MPRSRHLIHKALSVTFRLSHGPDFRRVKILSSGAVASDVYGHEMVRKIQAVLFETGD